MGFARAILPASRSDAPAAPAASLRTAYRQFGIQAKHAISDVDDPLEQKADAAAEAVLAGRPMPSLGAALAPAPQRKCPACEEANIQRECPSCGAHAQIDDKSVRDAATAVGGGGEPLAHDVRSYFEPRFGHDFSAVRVHKHAAAESAAEAIHATAYTLGKNIAFAPGRFAPHSRDGRRLIAHELAHVVQQQPVIARQPAPYHTRTFQDRSGGGTTDFIETVQTAPSRTAAGIVGSVDRSEVAPASGTQPQQTISTGQVRNIRFDPSCQVVVPYGINFQQLGAAPAPFCDQPPAATPVSPLAAAQFQQIQTNYIDWLNQGLNGWYVLRVEGCQGQPCVGRQIPIVINASNVTNNPDYTINVVNRAGRGNAGTICAGDFDRAFVTHEGGHRVLGVGDEYREDDPALRQRNPTWARDERVRTDQTEMGQETAYGRFSMYHERHFRFAQVFLEAVFQGQGCTVRLEPVRSPPPDFHLDFSLGGAGTTAGSRLALTADASVGLPLERQRRLNLLLGAHFGLLSGLDFNSQSAFMFGARAGLEGRTSPGRLGVTGDVFASGGYLHATDPSAPDRNSGYGEIGAGLRLHSGLLGSGIDLHTGAEAAVGAEFSDDPHALRWYRLGWTAGATF